jgi:hypothetical protein
MPQVAQACQCHTQLYVMLSRQYSEQFFNSISNSYLEFFLCQQEWRNTGIVYIILEGYTFHNGMEKTITPVMASTEIACSSPAA